MPRIVFIVSCVAILAVAAVAQLKPGAKKPPVPSPASGKDMYVAYCASCHGVDAKGNGPAASALKKAPTDLTTLAQNNGGTYPSLRVSHVIEGEDQLDAHGSREMPVWGRRFWTMSQGHRGEVQLRVKNLTEYIASLQQE